MRNSPKEPTVADCTVCTCTAHTNTRQLTNDGHSSHYSGLSYASLEKSQQFNGPQIVHIATAPAHQAVSQRLPGTTALFTINTWNGKQSSASDLTPLLDYLASPRTDIYLQISGGYDSRDVSTARRRVISLRPIGSRLYGRTISRYDFKVDLELRETADVSFPL